MSRHHQADEALRGRQPAAQSLIKAFQHPELGWRIVALGVKQAGEDVEILVQPAIGHAGLREQARRPLLLGPVEQVIHLVVEGPAFVFHRQALEGPLGVLFQQQGAHDAAIRAYAAVLAADPAHVSAYKNLGEALLAKGYYYYGCLKDYDGAIRYFEQARQILPNDSRIPESLAYVTRRRGHWEQSEQSGNDTDQSEPAETALAQPAYERLGHHDDDADHRQNDDGQNDRKIDGRDVHGLVGSTTAYCEPRSATCPISRATDASIGRRK